MNKTVTINISGIIFHIEEDAYERLSRYLVTIKGYFSKTDGGNEIMSDIEARVAELLSEKINAGKQVVLMADVEYVMQVMGKPEDFSEEGSQPENNSKPEEQTTPNEHIKRRLFRDGDNMAIGGVCSGLAAYFDVEIVWVRLGMVLLFFAGGLSMWVYLIMWIIIPEAHSTAEKLAMRGESANINNIMKNFKEEAQDLRNRIDKYGNQIREQNFGEHIRTTIRTIINTMADLFGRLAGLFILFVGFAFLLGYLMSLLSITIADSSTDLSNWKTVILESSGDYAIAVFAFILVCGIPVFMMIYAGIKLLFRIRYSNKWINLSLGIVWAIGLALGAYVTIITFKQFSEESQTKDSVGLGSIKDTLFIKMNPGHTSLNTYKPDNFDDIETFLSNNSSFYCFPEFNGKLGIIGFAKLDVTESATDSIELVITQKARGMSKKVANAKAKTIKYAYSRNGKALLLDEIFLVPPGNKFSVQEVEIKIKLPKDMIVYLDKNLKHMLYDVDNVTNTRDEDMVAHYWKVTGKGLSCLDCNSHTDSLEADTNKELNKRLAQK